MKEKKLTLLKNFNLLLIEDDATLLKNIHATLSIFFNHVFTANNGADALTIFDHNHIDMVITDYVMPVMDGYEFCRVLRERNKKIPVVFTSSYTDSEKLLNLLPLNLSAYIIKPIEYSSLIQTLLKMIDQLEENDLYKISISPTLTYSFVTKDLFNAENNTTITFSKSERLVLELLLNHQNSIVSNEMIELSLSPTDSKSEQSIKNTIYRLRKKLGKTQIINIQELGYILKTFY